MVNNRNNAPNQPKVFKQLAGIPRSSLVRVSESTPGAMMTEKGEYAMPAIDHQAYARDLRKKLSGLKLPKIFF